MLVVANLPFGLEAPSLARSFLKDHASSLPLSLCEDAAVLVSELVSNAVRHGEPAITLRVELDTPEITVSVTDHGQELPALGDGKPDVTAPSGRGLLIVAALADDWGVTSHPDGAGKTVWFSLHSRVSP